MKKYGTAAGDALLGDADRVELGEEVRDLDAVVVRLRPQSGVGRPVGREVAQRGVRGTEERAPRGPAVLDRIPEVALRRLGGTVAGQTLGLDLQVAQHLHQRVAHGVHGVEADHEVTAVQIDGGLTGGVAARHEAGADELLHQVDGAIEAGAIVVLGGTRQRPTDVERLVVGTRDEAEGQTQTVLELLDHIDGLREVPVGASEVHPGDAELRRRRLVLDGQDGVLDVDVALEQLDDGVAERAGTLHRVRGAGAVGRLVVDSTHFESLPLCCCFRTQ